MQNRKREESRKHKNLTPSNSVQFSRSVVSDSLQPHGLQHVRLPYLSQTPGACSNSCPWTWWCHPTISSSVVPFNLCEQQGLFNESVPHIRWAKHWSFILSICPSNEYSGLISFRINWLDLLAVQGTPIPQFKNINSSALSFLCIPTLTFIHDYWKNHSFDYMNLFRQSMSLLFNMLSRLVTAFLPRSKHLLISWLQSPSAVILESQKTKSLTVSIISPSICHKVMGPEAMILIFLMLSFKPFSLYSFTFIKRLFNSSLSAIRVVSSAYLRLLILLPAILIPACVSSSLAFRMMYSAYKLNKQGDNIQPWWTPFPIWSQSVVPCCFNCCFLTCILIS